MRHTALGAVVVVVVAVVVAVAAADAAGTMVASTAATARAPYTRHHDCQLRAGPVRAAGRPPCAVWPCT